MRVLLVGPDQESNLSLLYLAASLRQAGHEPVIAAFDRWDDAPAVLRAARRADLVGLSMCFQLRAGEFLALAAALKSEAPRRPIVAGGHHASCAATELLDAYPALDAIVIHEGEETLVALADLGDELVARAGEVPGVASRRDGRAVLSPPRPIAADLDRLPAGSHRGGAPALRGPYGLPHGQPRMRLRLRLLLQYDAPPPRPGAGLPAAHGRGRRRRDGEPLPPPRRRQFVFHDDNFLVPSRDHNHERIGRLDGALAVFLSDRRWRAAIGLFAVGVLCSPFVGIQMAGVLLPTLFLVRGPSRWQRFAVLAISAAFAVYYLIVLPIDPVAASIESQHQFASRVPLSMRNLVLGHGLAVLGAFSLADGSFRRWLWREPFGPAALFALVVSALPDSVLFARDQWSNPPAFPLLTVPAAQLDALAFLAKDPVPRRVLTFDLDLTRQVCAFTRHRPLFGTMFTTPDALGRWEQALRFRAEADRATSVGSVPIDVVLASRADSDLMRRLFANRAFRLAFWNEAFVIFRREF